MALRIIGVAAGAVIFALVSPRAVGSVVYNWTGTCTDECTGTATAVLTLANGYVPGEAFTTSDFTSFSYNSNTITYEFQAGQNGAFANGTPPIATGPAEVDVTDNSYEFQDTIDGWEMGVSATGFDMGDNGNWTLVQTTQSAPEPSVEWMTVPGLVGLAVAQVLARRRRSQACAKRRS